MKRQRKTMRMKEQTRNTKVQHEAEAYSNSKKYN